MAERPGQHLLQNAAGTSVVPPVAICWPTFDSNTATFTYDLVRLVRDWVTKYPTSPLLFSMAQGTYLHQQREDLIEPLIQSAASHVLCIDSDMRFPPDALEQLLRRGKRIIGVNYSTRRRPIIPTAVKDTKPYYTFAGPDEPEIMQVDMLGMGLVLIDLDVMRKLDQPRFPSGWNNAQKRHLGEDYTWCRRVRETLQEEIWIDNQLSTRVAHTGMIEYTMDDAITYGMRQLEAAKEQDTTP